MCLGIDKAADIIKNKEKNKMAELLYQRQSGQDE